MDLKNELKFFRTHVQCYWTHLLCSTPKSHSLKSKILKVISKTLNILRQFKESQSLDILVFSIYLQLNQANISLSLILPSSLKKKKSTNVITGVLEKERVRRLIHNYNLIYNLSLSPLRIDQALRRFRSGENVSLEPALRYLKEL